MRHHNVNRKFHRETDERRALLKSLAGNLVLHGKIKTTEAKAKEIRSVVEKLITRGKSDTVATKRILISRLGSVIKANKIIKEIAPRYGSRAGGYTRITKLPPRASDGSKMAIIELV
ncbi:MAG: 50S ribosomal protein L17 [bacterium]